nr:hypothetical protein HK105_003606 [Polyrhizophydium stewartii]
MLRALALVEYSLVQSAQQDQRDALLDALKDNQRRCIDGMFSQHALAPCGMFLIKQMRISIRLLHLIKSGAFRTVDLTPATTQLDTAPQTAAQERVEPAAPALPAPSASKQRRLWIQVDQPAPASLRIKTNRNTTVDAACEKFEAVFTVAIGNVRILPRGYAFRRAFDNSHKVRELLKQHPSTMHHRLYVEIYRANHKDVGLDASDIDMIDFLSDASNSRDPLYVNVSKTLEYAILKRCRFCVMSTGEATYFFELVYIAGSSISVFVMDLALFTHKCDTRETPSMRAVIADIVVDLYDPLVAHDQDGNVADYLGVDFNVMFPVVTAYQCDADLQSVVIEHLCRSTKWSSVADTVAFLAIGSRLGSRRLATGHAAVVGCQSAVAKCIPLERFGDGLIGQGNYRRLECLQGSAIPRLIVECVFDAEYFVLATERGSVASDLIRASKERAHKARRRGIAAIETSEEERQSRLDTLKRSIQQSELCDSHKKRGIDALEHDRMAHVLDDDHKQLALGALKQIHACGALHGDPHLGNLAFVTTDGTLRAFWFDLERTRFPANDLEALQKAEIQKFERRWYGIPEDDEDDYSESSSEDYMDEASFAPPPPIIFTSDDGDQTPSTPPLRAKVAKSHHRLSSRGLEDTALMRAIRASRHDILSGVDFVSVPSMTMLWQPSNTNIPENAIQRTIYEPDDPSEGVESKQGRPDLVTQPAAASDGDNALASANGKQKADQHSGEKIQHAGDDHSTSADDYLFAQSYYHRPTEVQPYCHVPKGVAGEQMGWRKAQKESLAWESSWEPPMIHRAALSRARARHARCGAAEHGSLQAGQERPETQPRAGGANKMRSPIAYFFMGNPSAAQRDARTCASRGQAQTDATPNTPASRSVPKTAPSSIFLPSIASSAKPYPYPERQEISHLNEDVVASVIARVHQACSRHQRRRQHSGSLTPTGGDAGHDALFGGASDIASNAGSGGSSGGGAGDDCASAIMSERPSGLRSKLIGSRGVRAFVVDGGARANPVGHELDVLDLKLQICELTHREKLFLHELEQVLKREDVKDERSRKLRRKQVAHVFRRLHERVVRLVESQSSANCADDAPWPEMERQFENLAKMLPL